MTRNPIHTHRYICDAADCGAQVDLPGVTAAESDDAAKALGWTQNGWMWYCPKEPAHEA